VYYNGRETIASPTAALVAAVSDFTAIFPIAPAIVADTEGIVESTFWSALNTTDTLVPIDAPFDKTIAVRQNGVVLPVVDANDGQVANPAAFTPDGSFDNNGYALDITGGTAATPNVFNFAQSGSNIGDAQVNLNVIFYDAVGNATNPNNTAADTAFNFEIDRTPPDVAFQGYVTPLFLGGSPTVTSSGSVRVTDANLDLNNSYVIIQSSVAAPAAGLTVLVNGQTLTIPAAQQVGSLTFAQAGLTSSSAFQPLELTFSTNPAAITYDLIIRSTDLARQLDEADLATDDDTLPQLTAAIAPEFLGFGNTANDSTTIIVNP
jgi:hypothetical protein